MIDSTFYERVVPPANTKKLFFIKLAAIAVCIIFSAVWILTSLVSGRNPALIIAVLILLIGALYLIIAKTSFEYEYSISDSAVTLAKIYMKKRRKDILSLDSDNIIFIAPKNDDNLNKCKDFKIKSEYDIYDPKTEGKLWIIVFEDKKEERHILTLEAEDYATKLLKSIKPSAMSFR